MDIDPPLPNSTSSSSLIPAQTPSIEAGPSRTRTLRARPSDPLPKQTASKGKPPKSVTTIVRQPLERELESIHRRLGPEGITTKRDELVHTKEQELKIVVDEHDSAIREQFHLERYVTLLTGWDPALAKIDNSPVFLEWKDAKHNLLNLLPQTAVAGPSQAGPSRRPRTSLPARTTRRAAHEQSEILASVVAPAAPASTIANGHAPSSKGKGKAVESELSSPVALKGKGKARAQPHVEDESIVNHADAQDAELSYVDMPPPSTVKSNAKGKMSRRKTMGDALPDSVDEAAQEIVEAAAAGYNGKKRGRKSLPNLPPLKKLRGAKITEKEAEDVDTPATESPAVDIIPEPALESEPTPTPTPLPSLAHLSFPAPPLRSKKRHPGPRTAWYTEPSQRPLAEPKYSGDVSHILSSYIHIEDTGHPDLRTLELRAAKDGYHRARVVYLQQHGRLLRLLDEAEETGSNIPKQKVSALPPRKTDHQDSLMAHMVQVRNAMLNEAKSKPVICKRIARMIQVYWERIEGKEERERLAEEREKKKLAKELVRAVRRRWALAVKVVRARILEAQKQEQDRLGKEHLQNMLQRSTGFLEAQVAGDADEDEDEDDDSDGTDDASSVEESDEDREDKEEEEGEIKTAVHYDTHLASSDPLASSPGLDGKDHEEEEEVEDVSGNEEDESENEGIEEGKGEVDLRVLLSDDIGMGIEMDIDVDPEATATATGSSAMDVEVEAGEQDGLVGLPPSDLAASDSVMTPNNIVIEVSTKTNTNGAANPITNGHDHSDRTLSSPSATSRSRRLRKIASVTPLPQGEDPDADDIEFDAASTSDLDEQDVELDIEMEDAESEDEQADSEDEGLLADADVPIEELLKRYGYPTNAVEDQTESKRIEDVMYIGETPKLAGGEMVTDKSLLDDALPDNPVSPQFVIEGKRQRRPRAVWTPEDNPPPPTSKESKPKIEEVESDVEMTPEPTSDEESDEEDEGGEGEDVDGDESKKVDEDIGPRVRPPFLLRGTLRPYQQAGLEWLASLFANKMNGILADEMGLGKTIQTISLLGHLACDKGVWGQHLIIVPTSVILNWEMEFKKFLPGMKVLTYYGSQKERKDKRVGWHTENAWQVCITSYQIVLADQHIFRRKKWVYMILDEAHNIKNFRSQRWQTLLGFKTQRRLLLTGTPLQNNLMELWSLLYFLMPGGVGEQVTAVVGFANHKEFMEWFSNPMDKAVESGDTMDEATLETISKLHTLLRPFILRRLKSEVETQLPGKFEHVVYCKLSKRQRFLYDEFMSRSSTKEALISGGYLGVMNTLMQLRKVCNHPDLFEVRPVRTSFAMDSVLGDYQPQELLIRRRLLKVQDEERVDLLSFGLGITHYEDRSGWTCRSISTLDGSDQLPYAIKPVVISAPRRGRPSVHASAGGNNGPPLDNRTVEGWTKYRLWAEEQRSISRWRSLRDVNRRRCSIRPIYGSTFISMLTDIPRWILPYDVVPKKNEMFAEHQSPASSLNLVTSLSDRARALEPILDLFAVVPPNVVARDMPTYALPGLKPISHPALLEEGFDTLHRSTVKLQIAFPDSSLLQYDCGKLQKLWEMLRDLKAGGHRVLIFTQMTKVLDILEIFLSYNGHRYLRLDGSTKIEDRQIITERFNSDSRIFVFIASSRSGGVGINLTGADTVFFYDSDWNPSMDRQCMDRAHRIGQTREVNIYRFVSRFTVEENMLKKANQKRLLDKVVIQQGEFTNDWWGRVGWKDMFGDTTATAGGSDGRKEDLVDVNVDSTGSTAADGDGDGIIDIDLESTPIAEDVEVIKPRLGQERELARVLAEVEDEEDVQAAKMAQGEGELDFNEFGESAAAAVAAAAAAKGGKRIDTPVIIGEDEVVAEEQQGQEEEAERGEEEEDEEEYDDDGIGGIEEYMLKWVEEDWSSFVYFK